MLRFALTIEILLGVALASTACVKRVAKQPRPVESTADPFGESLRLVEAAPALQEQAASGKNFVLASLGEVRPPVVADASFDMTSFSAQGQRIFVGYARQGSGLGGAISVIDVGSGKPKIVSEVRLADLTVRDLRAIDGELFFTGEGSRGGKKSAFLARLPILEKGALGEPVMRTWLPGDYASGIVVSNERIFATSLPAGGLSLFKRQGFAPSNFFPLEKPSAIGRGDLGAKIWLLSREALQTYDVSTEKIQNVSGGAVESPPTFSLFGTQRALLGFGAQGVRVLCLDGTSAVLQASDKAVVAQLQRATSMAAASMQMYLTTGENALEVLDWKLGAEKCAVSVEKRATLRFSDGFTAKRLLQKGDYLAVLGQESVRFFALPAHAGGAAFDQE